MGERPQFLSIMRYVRPEMLVAGTTEDEKRALDAHFAWMRALVEEGAMMLAGRTLTPPPDTFGVGVFEADDESAARSLVARDPLVLANVMVGAPLPYRVALKRKGALSESPQFMYVLKLTRPDMLQTGPTDREKTTVAEHFEYVSRLTEEGVMILVGRTQTTGPDTMGLAFYAAGDDVAARAIMQADPAIRQGVMTGALYPFAIRKWRDV